MKTVLITGTSSGIGKAAAHYFQQQGWNVAATMRNPEKETELKGLANVKLYALDVTNTASIDLAIKSAINDFGKIDAVVNNAGYGADGVFEAMDDDFIANQFNTNVFGLMRVTRTIIPYFRQNNGGHIIQIASMGGRLAFPLFSIYHGTKWAVEGFSEGLHWELKPFNIHVKIVEPGAIKTDFYGRSRQFIGTDIPAYKGFVEKVEKVNLGAGETGDTPETVAKAIFTAANDTSNKLRYAIGGQGPMLLRLRKLLPDTWWFKVVKTSYKL
jgi:NAD(P)-dependent dehydrogenase (short-subunit alcohol dehydrogenase family)